MDRTEHGVPLFAQRPAVYLHTGLGSSLMKPLHSTRQCRFFFGTMLTSILLDECTVALYRTVYITYLYYSCWPDNHAIQCLQLIHLIDTYKIYFEHCNCRTDSWPLGEPEKRRVSVSAVVVACCLIRADGTSTGMHTVYNDNYGWSYIRYSYL